MTAIVVIDGEVHEVKSAEPHRQGQPDESEHIGLVDVCVQKIEGNWALYHTTVLAEDVFVAAEPIPAIVRAMSWHGRKAHV